MARPHGRGRRLELAERGHGEPEQLRPLHHLGRCPVAHLAGERRPRIGADTVHLQKGGDGVEVLGAGEVGHDPAVGGGQQSAGTAARDRPRPHEPGVEGPLGEQRHRVDADGRPEGPDPLDDAVGRQQRWVAGPAGQHPGRLDRLDRLDRHRVNGTLAAVRRVTVDEALAGVDPFDGEPVVELTGPVPATAVSDLAGVPAVVVGVDIGPEEAPADRVERAVLEHPEAAVALAVLLRGGEGRNTADGLVLESATYSLLQAGPDHQRWRQAPRPEERPGDGDPVLVHRDGDELRITLHRPEVHNAYSAAMRDALVDALAVAAADPALRVVLDGAGPSFSAGGDLGEFGTGPDPAAAHAIRLRRSAAAALARVADRTTVHLHGACVGAGIELAAYAGRVVAAPGTRCWLPEVAMGLIPGAGGTVSIPRRIGRRRDGSGLDFQRRLTCNGVHICAFGEKQLCSGQVARVCSMDERGKAGYMGSVHI